MKCPISSPAAILLTALLVGGCATVGSPAAPTDVFAQGVPDFPTPHVEPPAPQPPPRTHQAAASGHLPRPVYLDGRFTVAGGSFEHDIDNPAGSVNDDTGSSFVGLMVEGSSRAGFGGGISMEMTVTNDDLFRSSGAPARAVVFEFAPFFLYRVAPSHRFTMPVRVGPWLNTLLLDDQNSSDTTHWTSIGGRVEVEPEVVLAASRGFEFSLFSEVSLAAGFTNVSVDTNALNEDYDSSSSAFGFEIGPRFRWSHFLASVSFLHRQLSIDQSDPTNGTFVFGVDDSFDGLAVSFGGGF